MDRVDDDALAARWRDASDEYLSIAVSNIADYTPTGQEAIRREVAARGLDLSMARDLAHAARLASLKASIRIERVFAVAALVTLALGTLLFAAVLNGESPANSAETFNVISVVVGLPFVVWFRQAYANLRLVSSRETQHAPGWAIGAWFVPFLNLWRPLRMMNELWIRSLAPHHEPDVDRRAWAPLPLLWWIAFVVWRVPDSFLFVLSLPTGETFARASQVLSLVTGSCAIGLIWQIDRQQQRFPSMLPLLRLPPETSAWTGSQADTLR